MSGVVGPIDNLCRIVCKHVHTVRRAALNCCCVCVADNINITVGNKTWMFFPNAQVTQAAAAAACQALGSTLLSVDSEEENSVLITEVSQWLSYYFWLGLMSRGGIQSTNRTDYLWMSTGLTPTWTNWDRGEPNNGGIHGEGVCVVATRAPLSATATWNDVPCAVPTGYGCQVLL